MNTSTKYPGKTNEENWFSFSEEELAVLIRALTFVQFSEAPPDEVRSHMRRAFETLTQKRHPKRLLPIVDFVRMMSDITRRLLEEVAMLRQQNSVLDKF